MHQTLKKLAFGLIILAFSFSASAQQYKKGFKAIEKGELEEANTIFQSLLGNSKEATAALMGMAKIYSNKSYPEYNLETAYEHITKAMTDYKKLDSDLRNKLQDDDKGTMDMGKLQRDIITAAYDETKKVNTAAAYAKFLTTYTQAMKPQIETATKARDLRGVEEAEKTGTLQAFEAWYKQSHATALKFAPEVAIRGQKGLFEASMRQNGWSSYAQFAAQYKDNVYVKDSVAAKSFLNAINTNTVGGFRDFLRNNLSSPFAKIAEDSLYAMIMEQSKFDDYDFFVRNCAKHPKVNDIWSRLYKVYIDGNGINSVFKFEESYPNFPFKDQLEKDKAAAKRGSQAPIFEKTRVSRDINDFIYFVDNHQDSPYFPELEMPMLEALKKKETYAAAKPLPASILKATRCKLS